MVYFVLVSDAPQQATIKVLLVEDDTRLAQLTARYLENHGVVVTIAADGIEGQAEALRRQYDCIVLDLMLPGRDGIEITRELRSRTDVPILMVTARGEEADRVLGLEVGADDYVTKPFSPRELLARIRATVRRVRGQAGPAKQTITVGGLVLDPQRMTVTLDGKPIEVTAYEFSILRALAQRPGERLERAGRRASRTALSVALPRDARQPFEQVLRPHACDLLHVVAVLGVRQRALLVRGIGA